MTTPWKICRAGVMNFWYYDEEYFEFEDGRLLLRGSNGSGKSVTMQSLVPLLFDGNKSPERLDPFGSRARKMESYLLSDGLDLEERTGYLFLEFEKADSGSYMTIGMGMRARKNMPMKSWYFILLDGRRVGPQFDFQLYKDLGSKVPLTEKELNNRLAGGGTLFHSQKDYRAAVNEHLFGFSDVEEFEELIELLIQLRSPKLSKEFKPTTMYEIMQNSLQTLSDDDLRPMSESIENMDQIKSKLEQLEISRQALERIGSVYDKYNVYQLANKAQLSLRQNEKCATLEDDRQKQILTKQQAESDLAASQSAQQRLDAEETALREKEKSLKAHDFRKLTEEKHQLERRQDDDQRKLAEKSAQLERQRLHEKQLIQNIRKQEESLETCRGEVASNLEGMTADANTAQFDEHLFFQDELRQQMDQNYSFTYLDGRLNAYASQLKKGTNLLKEQEQIEHQHDEALEKLSGIRLAKEIKERGVTDASRCLSEIKDEYVEKMFGWQSGLTHVVVPRAAVSAAAVKAQAYATPYYYDEIVAPVRTALIEGVAVVQTEINGYKLQLDRVEADLSQTRAKLDDIRNQKDLEPPREEKVVLNRQRLAAIGVPMLPLYKAIDFKTEASASLRGHLEEALMDLGILDALIIPPSYQEQVLAHDPGMADKYLFASPELFSHNLGAYLNIDDGSGVLPSQLIDDVLKTLFLDPVVDKTFITEKGHYGMGLLRGQTSGAHEPLYVGYQSRKRHKERQIEQLENQLQDLRQSKNELGAAMSALEVKVHQAYQDLEAFPKTDDLDSAFRMYQNALDELKRLEQQVAEQSDSCEKLYSRLKDKRLEVQQTLGKLTLPQNAMAYEEAVEALADYLKSLNQLKLDYKSYIHLQEQLTMLRSQLESAEEVIDGLTVDVRDLERAISGRDTRLTQIEAQFQLGDFQTLQQELETTLKRLETLPKDRKAQMDLEANANATVNQVQSQCQKLDQELAEANLLKNLMVKAFEAEQALGYVVDAGEKIDAASILKVHGAILEDKKKLKTLRDDLQERLLKETGQLAEYNLKRVERLGELAQEMEGLLELGTWPPEFSEEVLERARDMQRSDIIGRFSGREVKFKELFELIHQRIQQHQDHLHEKDRELFEEILIKTVSRKISARIMHSEGWVKKINELMESRNTSSGLVFHLQWDTRKAEKEDQLSTEELVKLLKMDPGLMAQGDRERLIRHFRSKIQESRIRATSMTEVSSFLTLMKEILDYRKWFEFRLFFTKKGDRRKEMTNNAFFTFSGGEKAMAMYVPLFSAVYAKYQGGRKDCPKIVSLDEAFAGVDEKNIREMFDLMINLKLDFIANSQVLYGDYETVPSLGIYELIRPENVTFVTLLRYKWNGQLRQLVEEV